MFPAIAGGDRQLRRVQRELRVPAARPDRAWCATGARWASTSPSTASSPQRPGRQALQPVHPAPDLHPARSDGLYRHRRARRAQPGQCARPRPDQCRGPAAGIPVGVPVIASEKDPYARLAERMEKAWAGLGGKRPAAELPRSVNFLEMYSMHPGKRIDRIGDLGIAEQLAEQHAAGEPGVAHGRRSVWSAARRSADLIFSAKADGDGVHGMVAGTTGSGKSELLADPDRRHGDQVRSAHRQLRAGRLQGRRGLRAVQETAALRGHRHQLAGQRRRAHLHRHEGRDGSARQAPGRRPGRATWWTIASG